MRYRWWWRSRLVLSMMDAFMVRCLGSFALPWLFCVPCSLVLVDASNSSHRHGSRGFLRHGSRGQPRSGTGALFLLFLLFFWPSCSSSGAFLLFFWCLVPAWWVVPVWRVVLTNQQHRTTSNKNNQQPEEQPEQPTSNTYRATNQQPEQPTSNTYRAIKWRYGERNVCSNNVLQTKQAGISINLSGSTPEQDQVLAACLQIWPVILNLGSR